MNEHSTSIYQQWIWFVSTADKRSVQRDKRKKKREGLKMKKLLPRQQCKKATVVMWAKGHDPLLKTVCVCDYTFSNVWKVMLNLKVPEQCEGPRRYLRSLHADMNLLSPGARPMTLKYVFSFLLCSCFEWADECQPQIRRHALGSWKSQLAGGGGGSHI